MAGLNLGDNVLVTFNGELFGQRIMNTFGYVVTEITGAPDDLTAFTELRTAMCAANKLVDKFVKCTPIEYTLAELWFQVVRPTRLMRRSLGNTATGPSAVMHANTANVASVLERRGGRASRSNISSLHVPAPTVTDWAANGLLGLVALTAMADLGGAVRETYITTTGAVKFSPSILNTGTSVDVTPIIETFPQETVRVMRRRTVRVGI